jgi:glycerophosphoryl diester phosphodiesterase
MLMQMLSAALIGLTMTFALHPGGNAVPLIVAHRGASFDAPENTLSSFKLAWEQGADAIEGDFYLTADQQIVTLHDATFKRTGGLDKKPSEMSLAEIRSLDVGAWKDSRFRNERVPTLDEVLKTVPSGKRMLIEIKCGTEIIPFLKRAIEASGVPIEQLRLICFNAEVVAESKKQIPALKAYWLTSFKAEKEGAPKHPTMDEVLDMLAKSGADGLDAKADLEVIDELFIATLRNAGHEAHFWTVDDPATAKRLMELGADSITTNRPAFLRQAIEPQH